MDFKYYLARQKQEFDGFQTVIIWRVENGFYEFIGFWICDWTIKRNGRISINYTLLL